MLQSHPDLLCTSPISLSLAYVQMYSLFFMCFNLLVTCSMPIDINLVPVFTRLRFRKKKDSFSEKMKGKILSHGNCQLIIIILDHQF